MNLIDNLLINFNTITSGLEDLLINENYIFVSDKKGNVLCTVYNDDKGRSLLEEYLDKQHMTKEDVSVSVMDTLANDELEGIFKSHQL